MIDDPESQSFQEKWSARSGWLLGAAGLAAWFAMLWFMFGDVL